MCTANGRVSVELKTCSLSFHSTYMYVITTSLAVVTANGKNVNMRACIDQCMLYIINCDVNNFYPFTIIIIHVSFVLLLGFNMQHRITCATLQMVLQLIFKTKSIFCTHLCFLYPYWSVFQHSANKLPVPQEGSNIL